MGSKVLAGRYEILDKIGGGGMAVVYRARDKLLDRLVAIKILRPEFVSDAAFVDNFRRESRAAASLTHPNIVSIFDVGKEGNMYYIVMELVEGRPLSDIIRDYAPMDFRDTIRIGMQVAAALREAHKNNVVHRDVKPHNILITDDGMAKITDFGIAGAATDRQNAKESDVIIGSVHYFSPEQGRGQFVDEKSDIYSLGIVLYEMLTGKVPFDADTPVAIAVMHMNDPMIPPSKMVGGVPPGLEQIIAKATEKYQVNRFKTVGEMYDALANVDYVTGLISDPEMSQYVRSTIAPLTFADEVNPPEAVDDFYAPEHGRDDYDDGYETGSFPDDGRSRVNDDWGWESEPEENPEISENFSADDPDETNEKENAIRKGAGAISKREKKQMKIQKNPAKDPRFKKFKIWGVLSAIVLSLALCYPLYLGVTWILSDHAQQVPQFVGLTQDEADTLAKEKGFVIEIEDKEFSETVASGKIISQSPKRGQRLKKGGTITVIMSKGKQKEQDRTELVPDLLGKSRESAEYTIQQYGYVVGNVRYEDSDRTEGTVIGQSPTGGTKLKKGSVIDIVISNGSRANITTVPNLVGRSEGEALIVLQDVGLFGSVGYEYSDTVAKGIVIRQGLSPGSEVDQGTSIGFVVSQGKEPPKDSDGDGSSDEEEIAAGSDPNDSNSTPQNPRPYDVDLSKYSVVGLTETQAKTILGGVGLYVSVSYSGDASGSGLVISQSPSSGVVSRGSTVTIVIEGPDPSIVTTPPATSTP
ncbi:MAG: PASTA domain-containing protein [Clostridiales Family XIII bacterium]|jgi:serine/threonine-protein kinase|nr:PASTA domain-containing protein [Clostridiales Family XIII bacterium]